MLKRATLGLLVGAAAFAVVAAASARPTAHTATAASGPAGRSTIGMLAPITGPAASIGGDQLHWAQFFVSQWNKGKHPIKLEARPGRHAARPGEGLDGRAVVRVEPTRSSA